MLIKTSDFFFTRTHHHRKTILPPFHHRNNNRNNNRHNFITKYSLHNLKVWYICDYVYIPFLVSIQYCATVYYTIIVRCCEYIFGVCYMYYTFYDGIVYTYIIFSQHRILCTRFYFREVKLFVLSGCFGSLFQCFIYTNGSVVAISEKTQSLKRSICIHERFGSQPPPFMFPLASPNNVSAVYIIL